MKGCARRNQRQHEIAMAGGWHAANFARAERLRDLDHYLKKLKPQPAHAAADEAAAMFKGLETRGLVRIREREKAS